MTIRQIIVSCNSAAEASRVGGALLKQRLIACYDVTPKLSVFYWPPKQKKITKAKGVMLVATTMSRNIAKAKQVIAKKHSDKVPFIGTVDVHDISHDYYRWLTGELRNHV